MKETVVVLPQNAWGAFTNAILAAHNMEAISIKIAFKLDGNVCEVVGTKTYMVDISKVTLELLTRESTYDHQSVNPKFRHHFEIHSRMLKIQGVGFYTALRANWSRPAFLWRVE